MFEDELLNVDEKQQSYVNQHASLMCFMKNGPPVTFDDTLSEKPTSHSYYLTLCTGWYI